MVALRLPWRASRIEANKKETVRRHRTAEENRRRVSLFRRHCGCPMRTAIFGPEKKITAKTSEPAEAQHAETMSLIVEQIKMPKLDSQLHRFDARDTFRRRILHRCRSSLT